MNTTTFQGYPLSTSQTGVFTDCLQDKRQELLVLPYLYKIGKNIDLNKLRDAIIQVAEVHPHLYTRIRLNDQGEPEQYTDRSEPLDVRIDTIADIETEKAKLHTPMQLTGGPLALFRLLAAPDANYLYLQIHHIIFDGISARVLLEDIDRLYRGQKPESEQTTAFEFAAAEQAARQGEAFKQDEAWYQEHFVCDETDTTLLPDLEDEPLQMATTDMAVALDAQAVNDFCQKNEVKPSVFFTSVYAFLLARYNGEEQVFFSTIWHGRSKASLSRSLGMFVHAQPCLFRLTDDMTIGDLLQQGETVVSESREHPYYSLADFCSSQGVQANLFFAYQGELFSPLMIGGEPTEFERLDATMSTNPLEMVLYQKGEGYLMRMTYQAHRYSKKLLEQLVESFATIARQMTDLKKPLKDLELVSDAQKALLDSFNETEKPFDDSETIVSLFRQRAKETPDKTAVVSNDRRFTYREIDEMSERLAGYIASQGLGAEDVVSILIPRCEWMAIAPLGVLKAGCAFQPLDPSYPAERLNFMMQDASAKLLIADEELRPIVNEYNGAVLFTKDISKCEASQQPLTGPKPESLFTMIYTSGSTGVPKGCQWEHRNIVAFCHMHWKSVQISSESHVAAYASFGFDASMMEIFPTLAAGAELHIIPEEIRLDLVALNDFYEQHGITHAFMTTQVAYQFATNFENKSLKMLMTGGEKLPSLTPPTSFTLHNAYGPSETVVYVTCHYVKEQRNNVPIGKAQDNIKLYIVDKFGHRLPVGASGEMWVSSPQVSRGYLNRPEKTAEVFVENPFITSSSSHTSKTSKYSRCYRTGDIVRYLPDGTILFVGRKDGQVKIRGFRIELKEVEAVIRQYPGIKDVTVQAYDEASGSGKYIAAYIVSDEQVDIQALNAFIMDEKPPYMVPAVTMQIEKIPLNQNGKVDKKALPKPEKKAERTEESGERAPLNVLEQELHDIIAGITGNEDFSTTTILGYAGLTSIMSIRLAIQVSKRYGVTLDSKTLAKTGTLQNIENEILSHLLSGQQTSGQASQGGQQQTAEHQQLKAIPLSYAQTGVYVECMKNPASTSYNLPTLVSFPLDTNTDELAAAVKKVVKAHPLLSVHFSSEGSEITQVPDPEQEVDVPKVAMSEAELASYKHEFLQPFNLKQGPLYRFKIITTEKQVHLLFDIHHLVSDGGSFDIFFEQLCQVMNGEEIEPEDATFADFVVAEKEAEKSESYQQARDFFQSRLGACEGVTEVPSDLTNPLQQGTVSEVVSVMDFASMEAFCREHNITPAHLTLAATFYALSRFTNNEHLCITTISNGRSNLSIRNTIGMFVNTLALSATVGEQSVMDFIMETSRNFDETLEHENYPFARIASDFDLSAEIMFAYQMGIFEQYLCQGHEIAIDAMESEVPKFRIAFFIREQDGKPSICIDYDNGRYSEGLMQHLADAIRNTINAFIRQPEAALLSVNMLDDAQIKLLDSFNQTDVDYDNTQTIVSLFRKQVATVPDNMAVVYHDVRLTYKQVDEMSERIAQHIKSLGLGAEDVVSVLIPRCEWMVVASLGVLKAGCAYQPLDPSYPAERLNFMMQDASAKLLIADEKLRPIVNEYNGPVLLTKDMALLPAATTPVTADITPRSLFIMLYTSGSTGVPKGCQLEHGNLVAFCHWYQRHYELTAESRVAAYASYGFDACMMDMYPALTCGATIYIIGEDIRLNLPDLNTYFNDNGITHSFITTQVGYQFATNVDNHSLKYFAVGGEKLSALQPPKNYKMFNGYGPTECTIFTTNYWVRDYEQDIPIGKPLDNMRLYIVDKQLNRLPAGAVGELWVSGPQVSRGYLNRPEKTAEVFIENPFVTSSSSHTSKTSKYSRCYRTGDIVRYLPDGNIQFVGRKDGQVKIRGFRIELKEVEAVIRQYPGIKDATVQAFDYENGGKYIAAYIVSDEPVDVKALNDFIGRQKPSYMIPAATMQIDEIPLNQNQKVNRKALPAPVIQASDREYVAPANDTEKLFCDIFADILAMEKIGALDNFFELGGTSLMVTRVIIEADKHGKHIAYGDLFSHPTPRQLTQFVNGDNKGGATEESSASRKDAEYDYTPINAMLQRNTLKAFQEGERLKIGSVLLTGSTGYLGIHVLKELIDRDDVPTIWCMVRAENEEKAANRLKQLLYYYFGKNFKELFGSRLRIALGDVTQEIHIDGQVDTVFNCAAMVKHFSRTTEIEDVNIGGAVNCVKFCLQTGARIVHVSTYSTAGLSVNGVPTHDTIQTEQNLYYGQYMENQYVHSKFVSERVVLEAAAVHGLNGKVMRVGNLAPRSTDGEFQINFQTNSAMGRIRVFKMLGCYPYEMSDEPMEFSPINEVAHSIVLLSQTPRENCLFHPFNNHHVYFGDVMTQLGLIGDVPRQVEEKEFNDTMETAKDNPEKAKLLSSVLAYQDAAHGQETFEIPTTNTFTTQVLYRLGFHWSVTSWDYVGQFLRAIDGLGYFDAQP